MSSTPKTPGGNRRPANPQASAAAASVAAPAQVPHPQLQQQHHAALPALSGGALLDAFPVWTEQHAAPDKDPDKASAAGAPRHEDALGLSMPPAAAPFTDAWKRADELLQGAPHVPMVCLKPGAAGDAPPAPPAPADAKKGSKAVVTSRELDGQLFAGHECFEWLLAVISNVMAAEKWLKRGDYLWELVHPKDKEGLPVRSPSGRYRVKLFLVDTWRCVVVDDRIPVDLFGRSLLVGSRPLQLWPLLLCKAILKVMATYRSLHVGLPNEVAAFQMLTGWPQEDLLDALGGTQLAGGALCDRLEEALGGPLRQLQEPPVVASCCLVRRSKPQRAPPRLLVLSAASGVGRSALIARLLAEFPDKFGVTVSTTSRPPREHEVDGRDYHFTDKHTLLAGVRTKQFLEAARVGVHSRPCTSSAAAAAAAPPTPTSYWYGTSLATVREVAATGKLCIMSLDVQGAEALWSNPRIDGLYLYISTSSPDVLAARQKQRLSEAASTLAKKLAWAKQQVAKASTPVLFDDVVVNTSLAESYAALKEAISKLSPIIRNRLRGRQAYVLDYSDLINPNSMEKPFLKPVILAGPSARGERRKLLEMLVLEFPDVFDFPRHHTTARRDEHTRHVGAAGDELQLAAKPQVGGSSSAGAGSAGVSEADSGDSHDSNSSSAAALGPAPVVLSREAFEAAAAAGQLLEAHTELFKHPLAAQRWGHSAEALQEVIQSGKLPLLELEAEEAELVKVTKGVDCLTVFLAPPSLEEHQQRLANAATESDEEVAQRGAAAAAELGVVQSKRVFDAVLHNDKLEQGYRALKAAISRFRPDLIPPDADSDAAARAAQHAAASQPVPVIIAGPAGGGRERLVQQLQVRFPQRFAAPRRLTDRKPGKADKEPATDEFVKPDVLARLAAQGQVVWSQPDTAAGGGSSLAVTVEGLQEVTGAGKMAVLDVGSATPEQLSALQQHPALKAAFTVYVCSRTVLAASLAAAGSPDAAVQAALAAAEGVTAALQAADGAAQALVCHDDPEEAFMQLQVPLAAAFPWAMPPVLQPLVVAGPFGSGKRAVLQKLVKSLPDILAVPKVVTSKPRAAGEERGMEVVTLEEARQMAADGRFLVHQEVLGHVYGITAAAVRRLQAQGKLPLLDLDRVQDVERLKASGLQASFVYLQAPSLEALQARITAEFLANPPLYHEPAEAAAAAARQAAAEVAAAAAQAHLFDAIIQHDPEDVLATLGQLGQQLHLRYPAVVPSSFVWGFGRPLWDPACRVLGLKPLRVAVLGPAASGKSVQSAMLAAKFSIPHVNVGDLLYAAVSAQTPAGLEAQRHMDANKGCVPDRILLDLLLARLQQPDCVVQGWVLDGFPHTKKQAAVLEAAGHVADKAILLDAPHVLLHNRVNYRRIDYATGKVYHLAEAGALSEGIRPLRPDGSPDADVLTRLSVRHDDSPENVAARLALWDRQVQGLRAAYEDVLLRLPAAGAPTAICARAEAFIRLEATLPSGPDEVDPGNVWPLVESWQLKELTYRVVATLRFKRQQLVQLQQLNGKRFFVNLKELAPNCSCMLLAHNPAGLPVVKAAKRLDTSSIQAPQLLLVNSPEPVRLVACLSMGPQHAPLPPPPAPKQVVVLAGPTRVGRSSLARLLLHDLSAKLVAAPVLTSRVPLPYELHPAGSSSSSSSSSRQQQQWRGSSVLQFVPGAQFGLLQKSHQLAGVHTHIGHAHAVHTAALEAAAAEGRAVLLVGSVHLAEQLRKDLTDTQVLCLYVDADTGSLDQRLRQQEALEEQLVQALLGDAEQQRHKLHALLEQQDEQLREQQAASAGVAAAAASSQPQTPASRGAAGAASAGKPTLQLPQTLALRAGQLQPQLSGEPSCSTSKPWLLSMLNADRQLHTCFTELKDALTSYLPQQQKFQPGLLLVQRCPLAASGADATSRPGSAPVQQLPAGAAGAQTAATAAADAAGPGLDADVFSSSTTVLRLRALTAASSQLLLPRGRHLLAVHCCPRLLHCVSLHSASEFSLEDADKLLPVTCNVHVVREVGTVAALAAGSRQLLFRFMLKPTEACSLSLDLQASSDALAACTRLLLLDIATGQLLPGVAAPQMQLTPAPRGYMLLALAEPCADVPGGSWSLGITTSHRLPPLTEVPCGRQAVFGGAYAANTQAVLARFVIGPATAVNVAALAQIQLPASHAPAPAEPHKVEAGAMVSAVSTTGSSTNSSSSSQRGSLPLRFSLQVFDTAGAKEVGWGASYPLLASVESHNGRALLPNLSLPPGRHLVVLQLQQQDSQQWVDPQTGDTSPPPDWQLQLIPSADDKACPITPDDAWERHCAATMEAWQHEAAAAAAAAAGSGTARPGSTGKGAAAAAAAAAKDRPRLAQAALERHLAEAAAATEASSSPSTAEGSGSAAAPRSAKAPAVAVSSSNSNQAAGAVGTTVLMPPGAARRPPATATAAASLKPITAPGSAAAASTLTSGATAADTTPSGASTADAGVAVSAAGQQWPGATPAVASTKQPTEAVPRQLKGTPDVLQLSPAEQVKWIKALGDGQQTASRAAAVAADAGEGSQPAAGAVLAAATNSRRQLQAACAQLQADQAAAFQELRLQCQAEQLSVLARKRQVIEALAPTPLFATAPPATASAAQAAHGPQAGGHGGGHKNAGGKSSSRA